MVGQYHPQADEKNADISESHSKTSHPSLLMPQMITGVRRECEMACTCISVLCES